MAKLLGILIISFLVTLLAAVPFIDLLYKLKFQRQKEHNKDIFGQVTSIVNKLHAWKVGTPNAGGILIIGVTILLSAIFYTFTKFHINWTANVLYFTLISFGLLGFYDDVRKFFGWQQNGVWGLKIRYKFAFQWIFAFIIGWLIYDKMGQQSLYIPLLGTFSLGLLYIPFVAFVIVAMTNAVNITDGLDGLATGLMVIALSAFWVLAEFVGMQDVSLFIATMIGSLLAFLYFNIFPARVWLGDTGALSLGAMLAVIALMINQVFVLPLVGLVFVVEVGSSLLQWWSKATRGGKKIFLVAPIHHHFEALGWDETKVTMRFWLAGAVAAFLGLFVALLER
ncbi:MAG: phospho-N-acetylmuramoyl-pentapeptide-transferase [Patescibacteria group bacterium]|nr:phospho-N-acetylmuramoyl-pentapeptide-transferase [Patescibacteria group bacterium]